MKKRFIKTNWKLATFSVGVALALTACASGPDEMADNKGGVDYTKMTPEAMAEYLILDSNSFKLDMPVQEGGTAKARMEQDDLQRMCTKFRGGTPDPQTASKVLTEAQASIEYPEGGIKLGDWEIGRELAWSGFGYRVGHKNDDHAKAKNGPGGNCYNCHQLATDRTGGNLGPSLTNYGKLRGNSDAMLKYAYGVIYNPHSVFPCTNMPRIGANGILTKEQILHIMAYLFDPESPVNN